MTGLLHRFTSRIRHAFAVQASAPLDADDRAVLDTVAREVVRRRLAAPALLALETCKPLGFLGAQGLAALAPFLEPFVDAERYRLLGRILERREGVAAFMEAIERASEAA